MWPTDDRSDIDFHLTVMASRGGESAVDIKRSLPHDTTWVCVLIYLLLHFIYLLFLLAVLRPVKGRIEHLVAEVLIIGRG